MIAKVKCPDCGLLFKKGMCVYSHRKIKHGYKQYDDLNASVEEAIIQIQNERSVSILQSDLADYLSFLTSWDGRGICTKTANGYVSAIKVVCEHLNVTHIYSLLEDDKLDGISKMVESESSRIACGIAKHITALKHLGTFFTARKRKHIVERKLDHHMVAFKVSVLF